MFFNDIRFSWLIGSLLRRRLAERYRGSVLGLAWAVLLPLGMLAVYTFFFRHLMGMRWPSQPAASDWDVALRIFLGLTWVGFAGEVIAGATRLVIEQPAYVKKMLFPLPVLAYALVGAALVQTGLALGVAAVVAAMLDIGRLWALPLVFVYAMPLLLWALALTWMLSGLGVFLRDLQQIVAPLLTILLFLSPVFYTVTALPIQWQPWLIANPLTLPIEGARAALLGDEGPSWVLWMIHFAAAAMAVFVGRWLFNRLQPGFSDAL